MKNRNNSFSKSQLHSQQSSGGFKESGAGFAADDPGFDDRIWRAGLLDTGSLSDYMSAEQDIHDFSEETYRTGRVLFLGSFVILGLSLLILCMLMNI